MKRFSSFLLWIFLPWVSLTSCITSEDYSATRRGDFEALWHIIDEHYCFFDYKQKEYGLDWNEVYDRYSAQINDTLSRRALFQILGNMCNELRDGHVNLWSAADIVRYADWYEAYPTNYSDSLERITLGRSRDHRLTGTMKYRMLRNNIGYLRCPTFDTTIGEGNLHEIVGYFATADGLIIDIRSNGGGKLTTAADLASIFVNTPTVVGYMTHKTGKGHNAFATPQAITLRPSNSLRWQKPVVVLTNRRTYSAANTFALYLKSLSNVTLIGDRTGGGSGMPFSSELPGGWGVRFSAAPLLGRNMEHTEFGIDPDVKVSITSADYRRGVDTILERAIDHLAAKAGRP